jgi:hypothetical protein
MERLFYMQKIRVTPRGSPACHPYVVYDSGKNTYALSLNRMRIKNVLDFMKHWMLLDMASLEQDCLDGEVDDELWVVKEYFVDLYKYVHLAEAGGMTPTRKGILSQLATNTLVAKEILHKHHKCVVSSAQVRLCLCLFVLVLVLVLAWWRVNFDSYPRSPSSEVPSVGLAMFLDNHKFLLDGYVQ